MNEQHLGDLLLRAYDSVPSAPFDPAEDLARARAAKRRRRGVRVGAVGTALVLGAALAVTTFPWGEASGGIVLPAAPSSPTAASSSLPSATPTPVTASSPTKDEPGSTRELAEHMLAAIRGHAAGSGDYLHPWWRGDEPGGMQMGAHGPEVVRFGVVLQWSRAGESNTGGIELLSAAAADTDTFLCGGYRSRLAPNRCKLVSRKNGVETYYGSTSGVRAASIRYPDGREVSIIASSLQVGNSLKPTTAALPTKGELIAIVSEPGLAWPSAGVEDSFPLPELPGS